MIQLLTFMLRLGDELADHGLDDADVAVEGAAQEAAGESHPEV